MTQPQEVLRNYQQLLTTNNSVQQASFSSMVVNGIELQSGNNKMSQQTKITQRRRKKVKTVVENIVYFLENTGSVSYGEDETLILPDFIEGENTDKHGKVTPVAFNLFIEDNEVISYGVRSNIKTSSGISRMIDNTFPPTYSLIEESQQPVFSCSVDANTNILTVVGDISLAGQIIKVYPIKDQVLPSPLTEDSSYFVSTSDGNLYLRNGVLDPVVNIEESGNFLAKYADYYDARIVSPIFYYAVDGSISKSTITNYTFMLARGIREFKPSPEDYTSWYGVKGIHYVGVIDNKLLFFEWECLSVQLFDNFQTLGLSSMSVKDSFIKLKLHRLNLLTEELEENIANVTSSITSNSASKSIINFEPITIPLFEGIPTFVPIIYDAYFANIGFDFSFRIIASYAENILIEINTGQISGDTEPYSVDYVYRYYTGNSYIELPSNFFDFTKPDTSSIFFGSGLYSREGEPGGFFTERAYIKKNLPIGNVEIKPDNTFVLFLGVDIDTRNILFYTTRTLDTPWGDIEETSIEGIGVPPLGRLSQVIINI